MMLYRNCTNLARVFPGATGVISSVHAFQVIAKGVALLSGMIGAARLSEFAIF